jgi:hypothetical protein
VGEPDGRPAQALRSLDRLVVVDPDPDLAGCRRGQQVEAGAVGVEAAGGGRLRSAAERPHHLQQGVGVIVIEVLDGVRAPRLTGSWGFIANVGSCH